MAISGFAGRFASARWRFALDVARWLFKQGRERLNRNLTPQERTDLWELMKRSKGRRANLSSREQKRFLDLVKRGATGRGE
jgi:hypothetical protein